MKLEIDLTLAAEITPNNNAMLPIGTCPACGQQIQKPLGWLKAHPGGQLTCPSCGAVLDYNAEEVVEAIRQIEAQFKRLFK